MSINFTADVFPLYATNVVTDAEYIAVDPTRRNQSSEQNMLTLIETVRAYMAELRDDREARMFHYVIGRMLAAVANSPIYDNLLASVTGESTTVAAVNGDTVDITTVSGTDNIVLALGPFANLAAVVADINGQISNAAEVEAFVDNGKLGFRNSSGNEGIAFTLGNGAGTSLLTKAIIPANSYFGYVETRANAARDAALAHFERVSNPVAL